jgi:M penetrans paralogue family 26
MDQLNPLDQRPLPNATAVLVLGILSIVTCFCYGIIGLILGIIAIVLAGKDKKMFTAAPEAYTAASFKNLNAGKLCAIIGIVLSVLYLIFIIAFIGIIGIDAMKNPEEMMRRMQELQK